MTTDKKHRTKKPWPTKNAMTQIYEKKLWGGEEDIFYSGSGSHHPQMLDPYIEAIGTFLRSFKKPLTVCDLGCGDFNVGKRLAPFTGQYIGIDIVPDLIQYNNEQFRQDNVNFHCLDIAKDELPPADCVILRNVLQHLSNVEIQSIVKKLGSYPYILITEHIPEGKFSPNTDIISGQGIRLKKQSGVDITAPPFNFEAKEEKKLLTIPYTEGAGILETTLFKTV